MENLAAQSQFWKLLGEAYNYVESFKQTKVNHMKALFLILCLSMTSLVHAQARKVAVVKIVRGEVDVLTLGKTIKLKVDDWVEDGAVVKTAEKSFAKLVFIDKSQMNIGPNSEMRIEKFSENDSGVIDLVKGKIRSQVTKDYLQIKDKDKSKLFIKTPNAVMGIRGTDFMISTNGKNTAAILFEGEVVFNKMNSRGETNTQKLEAMVDRGVRLFPGEFSVVDQNRPQPTVPSLLNIEQRETLEKNDSFERAPSNANDSAKKSVVPEGLDGKIVSNDSGILKSEMAQVNVDAKQSESASSNPDGYVSGDKIKPANGSFVHIESGIIIPPGKDSILDDNTNTYIPGPETGKISSDGSYQPPKNVEITDDGKMMVVVVGTNGEKKIVEVPPPSPVKTVISAPPMAGSTVTGAQVGSGTYMSPNDPANRNVSGGVTTVSDAAQQFNTGAKPRAINVCTDGTTCP